MSRNDNKVLREEQGTHMNAQVEKGNVLSMRQKSDPISNQFKQQLDDLTESFQKQISHNSKDIDKGDNDRTSQKFESIPLRAERDLDSASLLPAIMIDALGTVPNAEEADKVGMEIMFPSIMHPKFDDEKGNWQRPRSKSLEPGAIEDFYPMSMDSSDVCNESGHSSKGFLGFSLNSKFIKFATTGLTSPNESEMLISTKTLESSPEENEEDELHNDGKRQQGVSKDCGKLLSAGAFVQINKSFSGFAKRVLPSAAQSTAGLTLLHSAAVSQGLLVPNGNNDGKKTHSRTNTALSAYEINPSHSTSSKLYSLDDFEVIRKVGKGGFARVFLVQQKKSNRKYFALKCIKKADIIRLRQERQIMNEKNILKKFKHIFIVDLFHTFQTQNFLFMTLEFVPGGDLYSLMKKTKGFSEEAAKFYAAEVLVAVEYLHSIRIVYRDLKPENILLDATGHIKLADFGFARILNGKTRSFCGTPDYIAWEIVANKEYTHSVDWWSLGVLIFELVSGKTPFRAKSSDLIYENVIDLNIQWAPAIYGLCKDIIQKLLVINPAFRLGHRLGSPEIKMHMWFSSINWKKISLRQVNPPIIPNVNSTDSQNKSMEDPNIEFQEYLNDSIILNQEFSKSEPDNGKPECDPFKDF